ncbi:MAG: hypothetical protein HOY69_28280 [Streptomyces sp.]|nr:hypothetical protein [Streptomyces sp.]
MTPGERQVQEGPAELTFTAALRRLGHWAVLSRVLLLAVPLVALSVAFVPQPYTGLPGSMVGVPVIAWLIRRDHDGRLSPTDCDASRDDDER